MAWVDGIARWDPGADFQGRVAQALAAAAAALQHGYSRIFAYAENPQASQANLRWRVQSTEHRRVAFPLLFIPKPRCCGSRRCRMLLRYRSLSVFSVLAVALLSGSAVRAAETANVDSGASANTEG